MGTPGLLVVVLLVVVAVVLADRGLLAAERRGWIYYRTRQASKGAAAERLIHLASIWDPSAQHVLEQRDLDEDSAHEDPGPSDD